MNSIQEDESPIKIRLSFSLENAAKSFHYLIKFTLKDNSSELIEFQTEQIKSKEDKSSIKFDKIFYCNYYFYKIQKITITVNKVKLSLSFRNFFIKKDNNVLTLSTLITSKNGLFKVPIDENFKNSENKEFIVIKVENDLDIDNNISIQKNTFLDYIISGIHFNYYIAIDFSNNDFHHNFELKNNYLITINGIRETLYDFGSIFEVYGFGNNLKIGKILDDDSNGQFFFNLKQDKENSKCRGYTEIKYAYTDIIGKLDFSDEFMKEEKTNKLSPLLNYLLNKICEQRNIYEYNIIFILIDSLNEAQFQDCINCFIKSSLLPISFVIIGIGDNEQNFKYIRELCEINEDKSDYKRIRNNTYFISFKDCQNENHSTIKDKCMKKIPAQMCEFYEVHKISLDEIKNQNVDNKNSIKIFETFNSLIEQMNIGEKYKINNAAPLGEENKITNHINDEKKENNQNKKDKETVDEVPIYDSQNIDKNIDINNKNINNTNNNTNINNVRFYNQQLAMHTIKKHNDERIYKLGGSTSGQLKESKEENIKNPYK